MDKAHPINPQTGLSSNTEYTVHTEPIVVVIPYYQKTPGILQRALRSVFAQVGVANVSIIVVDDASPIPASSELNRLNTTPSFPVRTIIQKNGGPGAARNTALDSIPHGVHYIAFLDSDDEWSPTHLWNACHALGSGYDVYFADLMQLNATVSGFVRARRIKPNEHPAIAGRSDLHGYIGDMFAQIVCGNVIGTSTVVYNFNNHKNVRFRPEFRTAGEDYLFWIDLTVNGAKFSFSENVEAIYGAGVNVYSGAQWGSIDLLWRIHYEMHYRLFTSMHYSASPCLNLKLEDKRNSLRKEFSAALLHRIFRLQRIPLRLIWRHFRLDPKFAFAIAHHVFERAHRS